MSTHRYPIQLKSLAEQEIIVSELVNTIEIPNHNRVYPLSETSNNKYIHAILNLITGIMMEYRNLIADPITREVW